MALKKAARKKIWISLACVVVVLFICGQFYLINCNAVSTQLAIKNTAYNTVKTNGVFIRQEQLLEDVDGFIVQNVPDGGKVEQGGEVAKVFSKESSAANYTSIQQIKEKVEYYQSLQSQTLGVAADIESMDKSVEDAINGIVRSGSGNNLTAASSYENKLSDLMIRRQIITGTQIDFTQIISSLEDEIKALSADASPVSSVSSEPAGNFSTQYDGYESDFDYSGAANLTVADVEGYLKNSAEKKDVSAMGKMITGFNWYIACVLDSSLVSGLNIGSRVSVAVSSNSSLVIDAEVFAKNVETATAEKTALILKANAMSPEISGLRNEEIEIRLNDYSGLRIDSRGLVIDGENKGVYVLVSNKVVYRKVEILYSGEGFVIAKLDNSGDDSVQLYDQIIVEGKDLYDGKFIN